MSDNTTIARPYAKAIFEHALAEKKLAEWSKYLNTLAQVVMTPEATKFITNPASKIEQQIELLQALLETAVKQDSSLQNLIALLAVNRRLLLLPAISFLYEIHKADQEKTLDVDVFSFAALTSEQEKRMIESLSNRLQRKVELNVTIDTTLLGGAVVKAGDLVIDGSVRGMLKKLENELAA